MILNDKQISELAADGMITPFADRQHRTDGNRKVISYGLSSYGYDVRVDSEFVLFPRHGNSDPKSFKGGTPERPMKGCPFILPPRGFALAKSFELFRIPGDVMALCQGKSTYARCGLIVPVTPLEPGWEGFITLELANVTDRNILIYPGEGIMQVTFWRGERPAVSYADRGGKYQNQQGIVEAMV